MRPDGLLVVQPAVSKQTNKQTSISCQVFGFEPDCPVLGRRVRLKISARTGHRYTDIMYTNPDTQFLAPARSLEIGRECAVFFQRADLATLQASK